MYLNTVISYIGWGGLTFIWLGPNALFLSLVDTTIDDVFKQGIVANKNRKQLLELRNINAKLKQKIAEHEAEHDAEHDA